MPVTAYPEKIGGLGNYRPLSRHRFYKRPSSPPGLLKNTAFRFDSMCVQLAAPLAI